MTTKTKKIKTKKNRTSKLNNVNSVWGKNKPLEKFWRGLAEAKYVIVIYKNGKHKKVTVKNNAIYDTFDADENVVAVLSSSMSQDAYETSLYPKAKGKTVDYVIKNYKKFFISIGPNTRPGMPEMKKVLVL
jgi:hypothetical protein